MAPKRLLITILKFLLLIGAVYWYYFFDPDLEKIGLSKDYKEVFSNIISSAVGLVIFMLFLNLSFTLLLEIYRKRRNLSRSQLRTNNVFIGLKNITILISVGAIIITGFAFFGIDLSTLFTSLSIVAAAIAIITKEYLNDLIVGIYLGFSRDFEIGDYVKIEGQKGKVTDIGLLKLRLLNDDDDIVLLSNTKVYTSEIVNYTKRDLRMMSIDFQLPASEVRNIDDLEANLTESVGEYSKYIDEQSYNLKIVAVMKDYLDLKFQYRLKDNFDRDLQLKIRRRTVRKVLTYITSDLENEPQSEKGSTDG